MLLGAWREDELVGYACLYWQLHLDRPGRDGADERPLRRPGDPRQGVGRALIEASAAVARERGAQRLEWATAPDNETAQRLYDSTGAKRSTWVEYELNLRTPSSRP